jgi:hypothetical protein
MQVNGLPFKDQTYLEQLLLVKGWRKYNWNELKQIKAGDTTIKSDSLSLSAQITKGKKLLQKPLNIGVFGDEKLRLAITSETGFINLNTPDFIHDEKKDFLLFINDPNKFSYHIEINDPFLLMSKKIPSKQYEDEVTLPSTLINNAVLVLKDNEKSISLKEVVIKSKRDNSFMGTGGTPGRNACGDYVCFYNILNCKNHPFDVGNTQPVKGRYYGNLRGPYKGCVTLDQADNVFVAYDAIRYGKEFYIDDYKDLREPAFFSTIYWNYGVILNGKKDVDLSFFTSDITGKFKVVVQGVVNSDVAYAEHFFEVVK